MKRVSRAAALLLAAVLAVPEAQAQSVARALAQAGVPGSPFLGGVPSEVRSDQSIPLTLIDTIRRALDHNLGVLTAELQVGRAEGGRWQALSDLLPNVSGYVTGTRQQINLAAFGFPLPAGMPSLVGPFNVFDARVRVSQGVVDLKAVHAVRAEQHRLAAARLTVRGARDLVVLVAGNMYLETLAAQARVTSAEAQLETAQRELEQAMSMKAAGMVAGIDVLRAEVQRGTEQLRATAARNGLALTKLQLARVIGLPPGQAFTISSEVPDLPTTDLTVDQALERAYRTRPDYLAALERLRAAESERQSAIAELLPSVRVNADYGRIGHSPGDALGTYAVGTTVTVPVFNGGRSRGRLLQTDADLRQRRAEVEDLKSAIDYGVRSTFLELQAGRGSLDVATRSRDLSARQLTQARDRFAAGVASNVEVVQAQEAVAAANEQYISAFYAYNSAKALLARDLGEAEATVLQLLGGGR